MLLMYRETELAQFINDNFVLNKNIDINEYPPMFLWFQENDLLSNERFLLFLENRFPPASRESSHLMCSHLGIPYPNKIRFLELTRGATVMDDIWVKLYDTDEYENFRMRPLD